MAGECDLTTLLNCMRPRLNPGRYVFTVTGGGIPCGLTPIVTVAEREGLTLIVRLEDAGAAGLPYEHVFAWITLEVHSALEAVGLTAAVARELADAAMSCNLVAGFHHDHLFVRYEHADQAITVLNDLARRQAPSNRARREARNITI